jgi:hypothetical protein
MKGTREWCVITLVDEGRRDVVREPGKAQRDNS